MPSSSPQTTIDRESPLPVYAQIKRRLAAMLAGWRGAGERFYGDEELAAMFGASRMTVRRAVDELVEEGFLVRRRGVGTFVAGAKVDEQLNAEVDFFDQWASHGRTLTASVIALERRPCPAPAAERLGIDPGAPVVYIERLRTSGTVPVAFDVRYVIDEFAGALTRRTVAHKSILDVLRERYALAHADYRIEATLAGEDDRAEHLRVLPGDPLLVRKLYFESADGVGLMLGQSLYRAEHVRFAIRVPLGGRAAARRRTPDLVHEFRRYNHPPQEES